MKPVAIFRHSATEGPAYFATVLDERRIPWKLIKYDDSEPGPGDPQAYSGLCFMGGPRSVNDDLPWISDVLELIRAAVRSGTPMIGHCLGGQLMAKGLGVSVSRNPVKEIGRGTATAVEGDAAQRWLGGLREFLAFHWHGETFTIPQGASRILASPFCANQAFALGPHLALQCHVEMTPELIRAWCRDWDKEVAALAKLTPSVQTPAQIEEEIEHRVRELNAVADRLYARWIEGLRD